MEGVWERLQLIKHRRLWHFAGKSERATPASHCKQATRILEWCNKPLNRVLYSERKTALTTRNLISFVFLTATPLNRLFHCIGQFKGIGEMWLQMTLTRANENSWINRDEFEARDETISFRRFEWGGLGEDRSLVRKKKVIKVAFRASRFQNFLGEDTPRTPYKLAPPAPACESPPSPQFKLCSAVPVYGSNLTLIRELKHGTFLSHGRQPEANISHARTVVSPRFSN